MTTSTETKFTAIVRNVTTGRDLFFASNLTVGQYAEQGCVITGRDGRKMVSFKLSTDVEFLHGTEVLGRVCFSNGKVYWNAPILVQVHDDGHILLVAQVAS